MCTLLKRFLSLSLCSISLFTLPAMAQQISTGGVIHFRGAIVESPCDVNARQQQIATVKMHYLNEQKNMAILNIEYK